ncbi:Fc.00g088810.m01.CDS01 [Cosmosporella sp. VM-42]
MAPMPTPIEEFLAPLHIDLDKVHTLSQRFLQTFESLAAESQDQFLPTPISESILRPAGERSQGCHLAIDIGGTNLRVGFVEVRSRKAVETQANGADTVAPSRVRRLLEKSWPIDDHLKNENPDSLFLWIGKCIAEVVHDGCETLQLPRKHAMPLGVTFSFPMVQHSLSEATLMSMGKGFAITSDTNLGSRLMEGYARAKTTDLPDIRVYAIANDSVSTLVSFIFKYNENENRKAAMGLILGTGCNATIPLKLSQLHPSKHPQTVSVLPSERVDDVKITVNTEWSIKGTAPPLREVNLISWWDEKLDSQNETPGFQPLEYMTAGRYLGELGRIMLVDYLTTHMGIARASLPAKVLQRHSLTTTFLSHFKPLRLAALVGHLSEEFPGTQFTWTEEMASALYHVAKAIEVRAAGIVAAATLALLTLAGEIPPEGSSAGQGRRELGVGYTGGCIVHFQDYLVDCQQFLDGLLERRLGEGCGLRVILKPCHDGGITGAGILVAAAAAASSRTTEM